MRPLRLAIHIGALCLPLFSSAADASAADLIVDIDFNDEVAIRREPITEEEVGTLVHQLHEAGTDALLVRMGYLGYLPYRTELSYPMHLDAEHARRNPPKRNHGPKALEAYIESRSRIISRYRKVLDAFNPPEVFVREGHKHGMKVIFWVDIFDDFYSGYRSKFLEENPHCQWTARDGETVFKGLTSYAWPEARAFRVSQAKELLDFGADGIHCSTSAHCRHLPNVQDVDAYGFEDPVVAEYRRRYGVDIRTAEQFDKEAWHTIKGEFMNQLYRQMAAECHRRGKEFWIGLQLGPYTQLSADPHFGTNVVARYRNLWKPLVDEGIADAFILGDYELCSRPEMDYWKMKALTPDPKGNLFKWAAAHYGPYCEGRTKLYLFGEWLPRRPDPDALKSRMAAWARRVNEYGFDGIDVHEAMNFQIPGGMKILAEFHQQLSK